MGTTAEKRFEYSRSVSDLKQFFYGKKRQLENDIIYRTISDSQMDVARKYISIVESVLKSTYLQSCNYALKVHELMAILKEDDVAINKEIETCKWNIRRMQQSLNASNEEIMAIADFTIPDEMELQQESIIAMKRDFLRKIEVAENELERCEYRLKLCRNLKGMICRPNGFYNAVYK